MASGPAYRCDACSETCERCASCRARRAKARAELRDARRAAGLCTECGRKALLRDGERLTLCRLHARDAALRSNAAHKRARAATT